MFHPIGSRPPAVYWRRRLALCAVLGLVLLSAWVLRPGADKKAAAAPATTHLSPRSSSGAAVSPSTHATSGQARTTNPTTSAEPSKSGRPRPTTAPPRPCSPAALKVVAVVGRSSYSVGDQPVVMLQVTNAGPVRCVQDLADSQVELRVYNGESRVWGSHDCTIQAGISDHRLAVGQPVRVSVVWSGLSSQPSSQHKCPAGTRQRVGAGTYTLYALLAGREGAAAQFSIS